MAAYWRHRGGLRDLAAAGLEEPAAPREVHRVTGLPMTAKDKIDTQALRAGS